MNNLAIILIVLSIKSSFALTLGEPLMPQNVLKKVMSKAENDLVNGHQCHNFKELFKKDAAQNLIGSKNTDYFTAKVECEISCGKKAELIEHTADFVPHQLGLYQGDGTSDQKIIWRSLAHTIDVWSKQVCADLSQDADKFKCQHPVEFKVTSIRSGEWEFRPKLDCKRRDVVLSPFDDKVKLDNPYKEKYSYQRPNGYLDYAGSDWAKEIKLTDRNQVIDKYIDYEGNKKCQHRAKVETCFGDCVFDGEGKKWIETLITPEYLGDDKFDICLDDFASKFESIKSESLKDFNCHKLIYEVLMRAEATGTSCAAFRYNYTCPF
jgi:hypothetical protein